MLRYEKCHIIKYFHSYLRHNLKKLLSQFLARMSPQKPNSQTSSSEFKPETKLSGEASPKATIGDYHTAPAYMKDNEHITHGYRINFDSPKKIFKSLFMVHNESVNIWSHFLPALIICIAIICFAIIVDHQQMSKDISSYKQEISESFDHYMHALDNVSLISEMQEVREQTQIQLEELRRNAMQSFGKFTQKINENMLTLKQTLELSVHDMQESAKEKFYNNFEKFQQMKNDYEHIIAPALIDQINSLNNSYINNIREQIALFKSEIDSEDFNFIDFLHNNSPNPQHISRWPLMVFLFSAFVCLMCSTFFHLFYPMSSKSYVIFSRFDYAGISLLIAGSSFPPLYYGMYCYLEVALVYEIIIMTFAISIFILSVFEWMHRPQNVKFKAAIYGGFGLFNIIPVSHLLINDIFFDDGDKFSFASSLHYYVLLGFCYLFGLYIYTVRCPERHYPGKFNLCGHSHQIWHMFVVLGIVFTYFGAMENFEMRKESTCPIPLMS